MKTLHLLRHAKSSWAEAGIDDHDRDLNDRGRRAAPRMGAALAQRLPAQVIHVSSALRAQRTLEGLVRGWPELAAFEHRTVPELYTFDWREVLRWLQTADLEDSSVFIIGHNPALTELCNQLVARRALDNLPTAGYLRLSADVASWSALDEGLATLEDYLFPRDLPREG